MGLYLLDYGAGNVRSLANTIRKLGYSFQWIKEPADFTKATVSLKIRYTSVSQLTLICLYRV